MSRILIIEDEVKIARFVTLELQHEGYEVESGDRMEFQLSGSEYGLLIEGDAGKLAFQGTRFLGFDRI